MDHRKRHSVSGTAKQFRTDREFSSPQMGAVPVEATCATGEPHQRSLSHCRCAPRIFLDSGPDGFPVPIGAMLNVEHSVKVEVTTLAIWKANPAQAFRDACRLSGRGQLDDTRRSYQMPRKGSVW
jgi:hypothetical protein